MINDDGAKKYFEKLAVVEKFCNGDTEIAKKVLKGEYNDIIVLKGRFKDELENYFGIFMIFIGRIKKNVIQAFSVISNNASVYRIKPFDPWGVFFNNLEKEYGDAEIDLENIEVLNAVLERIDELKFYQKLFSWLDNNDIKSITESFEKVINKVLQVKSSELIIDFEYITSIVLWEEKGIKPFED